jgi:hypothetical protein
LQQAKDNAALQVVSEPIPPEVLLVCQKRP